MFGASVGRRFALCALRFASGEMQVRRMAEKWTEGASRRQFLVGALGVGFTAGGGGSLINERGQIDVTRHVLNSEASLSGGRVSFVQLSICICTESADTRSAWLRR